MKPKVYLAGQISGLSYGGATDWRKWATLELAKNDIEGLDPMRAKKYLSAMTDLDANCREYGAINVLSAPKTILTRDRWDATRCDILLANLLDADRVSIGTVMEIAWADAHRIPIVLVAKEGDYHDHAMINECVGVKVPTLEEAVNICIAFLRGA